MGVVDARQLRRQLGQLEVVGGEQGKGLEIAGQMFRRRPGQAQAIEGAGAAADLVHQHQTLGGGVVEDVGGFRHLHHEGGAATGQVIRRTDTGKDPVQIADAGAGGRHTAAQVGEQGNQRGLAHVGGFTAHVRASDDHHTAGIVQMQAVGHEGVIQHLLHHRVAAIDNLDDGFLVHQLRAYPVQCLGAFCQGGQHIQFGHGSGAALQGVQVGGHFFQQLLIQTLFQGQRLAGGRQGLVLEFLQLRGNKALGILQGLAALVIHRRIIGLSPGQLDVIAVDLVVLHPQGGEAGALTLAGFNVHQHLTGVLADGAQLVQFLAVSGGNHAAIADQHGRVLDDGPAEKVHLFRELADAFDQFIEGIGGGQSAYQGGHGLEAGMQASQIPGPRRAQGHPAENPFHVADVVEHIAGGLETPALAQRVDLVLALIEGGAVA